MTPKVSKKTKAGRNKMGKKFFKSSVLDFLLLGGRMGELNLFPLILYTAKRWQSLANVSAMTVLSEVPFDGPLGDSVVQNSL